MPPRTDTFFLIKKNFTIFAELYEQIATGYVDAVNPETLMRTGIRAMLSTLDPYTQFFDEADNEDIDIMTQGQYGGIGVSVAHIKGKMVIMEVMEGYDAERKGLKVGDILVRIEDQEVDGLTPDEVSLLLRGDPGTQVRLMVQREGSTEPLHFTLTRARVHLKNVSYVDFLGGDTTSGIGYVRLERFAHHAADEVRKAIQTLEGRGTLRGLILDLRGNPGGLLGEAVQLAGLFVPRGSLIVSTRGRLPESVQEYRSQKAPVFPDRPLVVLVDGRSASASEIVAGAVQDLDRGVVLGERTYGKGLVQIIRQLPYHTSLKMTTARYYTPSGRCIQAVTYTHREEDGYAVDVADSLRKTFFTRGGRPVRDGGGIEPDVSIAQPSKSELERALEKEAAYFFFAGYYLGQHPELQEVHVNDDLLQAFIAWLDEQNFSYRLAAEKHFEALRQQLEAAGYERTDDELAMLYEEIEREKREDFKRYAERLKYRLEEAFLRRLYTPTERLRRKLPSDPFVKRASALITDEERYREVLTKK